MPKLLGVHHIRLPVLDIEASVDWFRTVLGFEVLLYEEDENMAVGAALHHTSGIVLGLHKAEPAIVSALEGFNILGLTTDDLTAWDDELDRLGVVHGEVTPSSAGYYIEVMGPNGSAVRLHTVEQPIVEEC